MSEDRREQAFTFAVGADDLLGILHPGDPGAGLGVVVVVGGPQYRVGSHRQFVLLARRLAAGGFPVLRFDYRGIGDSAGAARDFEAVDEDIRAAVDALVERSGVQRVVLWGLCDAASAAMMYAHRDPRVHGLVLLNPWVHTAETEARVRIKSYYRDRLRSAEFWRKLLSFDLDWRDSIASLWRYAGKALGGSRGGSGETLHFIERMRLGWQDFGGASLLILSGDDLTAGEFRQLCGEAPQWRALRDRPLVQVREHGDANHTFSSAAWRGAVEEQCLDWLRGLVAGDRAQD